MTAGFRFIDGYRPCRGGFPGGAVRGGTRHAADADAVQGVHVAAQPGGVHGGAPAENRRPPGPLRAVRDAGAGGLLPGFDGGGRLCGGGRL